MAKKSIIIGELHMTKECLDCGKRVQIKLRSAISGGKEDVWMVQVLAFCVECGKRLSQSEWVEMPDLDMEMEIYE